MASAATATGASTSTGLPPQPTTLCGKPAPRVAWIEPGAIGAYARAGAPPSGDDVRKSVRALYGRGVTTLVLAYVEYFGCFYYRSAIDTPFTANVATGSPDYIPKDTYCASLPQDDFVKLVFEEADALGMKVVLGLVGSPGTELEFAL